MLPLLANAGYSVYADGAERREFDALVSRVLDATGADKVDLVGHCEGTVMP